MNDIVAVCGLGVVSAVLALTLKKYNRESALFLSIGAGVLMLLYVIRSSLSYFRDLSDIIASAGISEDYIVILLKVLGICFLTEFCCDAVSEAGLDSLSGNIALCGKILSLFCAMPLFSDLLSTVSALVGG